MLPSRRIRDFERDAARLREALVEVLHGFQRLEVAVRLLRESHSDQDVTELVRLRRENRELRRDLARARVLAGVQPKAPMPQPNQPPPPPPEMSMMHVPGVPPPPPQCVGKAPRGGDGAAASPAEAAAATEGGDMDRTSGDRHGGRLRVPAEAAAAAAANMGSPVWRPRPPPGTNG